MSIHIHATSVSLGGRGVLLRGASGAGKTTLALRLIREDATRRAILISDDQTALETREARVFAAPPPKLAGKMELRGIGIIAMPYRRDVPVRLVVDLVAQNNVPRFPEMETCLIAGVRIACIHLCAFEPVCREKIYAALASAPKIAPARASRKTA